MNDLFDLTGRVAIITGASRGLGKAMAVGLGKAGANVVVTDILDTSETVNEIRKLDREVIGLKVDVRKKVDIEVMVQQTIIDFGKVDILVNAAGILMVAPIEMIKEEDWDNILNVNLKGTFLCSQEVGRQMIKQNSGKIINIASGVAITPGPYTASYNVSKAGVVSLTKTLASEWGKHNIHINVICPGSFATSMTENFCKDEDFLYMIKRRVPLGRYGEPEELVGTAIYLASNASDYVTGHALVIDGGWTSTSSDVDIFKG